MSQAAAQARSMGIRGAGFRTITSQFITKGKKDVYWGKFRKKEKAITTDIAGRKLRTRNYHSPRPGLVGRDTLPFFRKGPKSIQGRTSPGGGYKSATRTGVPWKGDISGHKLRRNEPRGLAGVGIPWGKGSESATKTGRASLNPLPRKGRSPSSFAAARYQGRTKGIIGGSGFGAQGLGFSGRRKSSRPLKGGGSVSGKHWNNQNQAVDVNTAGMGTVRASQFKGRTKGIAGGTGMTPQGAGFGGYTKTRKPPKGGGSVSGKSWNNNKNPLAVKIGGAGTLRAGTFQGRTKGQRPLKGGGSVSGKHWSNNNNPIAVKQGGVGSYYAGTFKGRTKSQRPLKGGGSVSGKHWSNNNNPIPVKQGGVGSYYAGTFQGRTKGQRPLKGGGSVSGKHWNNKNQPVDVNTAGQGTVAASQFKGRTKGIVGGRGMDAQGVNFSGYARTRRPPKGGGSVSGKHWTNNGQPVSVNTAGAGTVAASQFKGRTKGIVGGRGFDAQGVSFPGYAKTRRPPKGGGSVSGKHWSNNDQPVSVNTSGAGQIQASQFRGRTKYKKPAETAGKPATFQGKIPGAAAGPALTELGFDYEGDYKRKKHRINNRQTTLFAKLLNIDKSDALKVTHSKRDESIAGYRPNSKRYIFSRYVQNPKANDASLKKDRVPNGLIINFPIVNQMRRPVNMGHYSHSVKQDFAYKRNPNSARGALKLREPGKAYARMADLQLNVKMKKHYHGELHPDAKFAHGFRDNVKEERTIFMNIKLTWAKLFKKNDTQPHGLKQKVKSPRYNPNEKGLWYD
jgi:hypothetical protein